MLFSATSEPQPATTSGILVTGGSDKIEFEPIIDGPELFNGITFHTDVDWSLSAIPFLARSPDWLSSDFDINSGRFYTKTRLSSVLPPQVFVPPSYSLLSEPSPSATLLTTDTCLHGSLSGCTISSMCVFGSTFAFDGSFTGRCTCAGSEPPLTLHAADTA